METFENIQQLNINYPKNLDQSSYVLLQAIFKRDPNLRPSIGNIKRFHFFADLDWSDLDGYFEEEVNTLKRLFMGYSQEDSEILDQGNE